MKELYSEGRLAQVTHKLTVTRGASVSDDEESWDKVFYSIEVEVENAELQVVEAELQGMINAWIVDALVHPLVPISKTETEQIPKENSAGGLA